MGTFISVSGGFKRCIIFLNISFLFLACLFLVLQLNSSEFLALNGRQSFKESSQPGCRGLQSLDSFEAKCSYLKSKNPCVSQGYIDYLSLFYCNFHRFPMLGHCFLFLWLLVLFYLLGNTASEYFCSSLENLSKLLKLSPTISGVTLLSLGNGAPDVFASLVSFMGNGTSDIGFNTAMGGASFVTCVVVGVISILVRRKHIRVNKEAFVRDICFFLLVLASLVFLLLRGKINIWGAMGFLLMYVVYVIVVYISDRHWNNVAKDSQVDVDSSCGSDLAVPILSRMEKGEMDLNVLDVLDPDAEPGMNRCCFCLKLRPPYTTIVFILEMPLYLPRRLTIPVVCQRRWSKPIAVISVTLAPILLSILWNAQEKYATSDITLLAYGIGVSIGLAFGVLAYFTTEDSCPPKKFSVLWLAAGFLMSVIWSYITAQELVALLVSLGYLFGISPSILGLTVLAWGNSLGDLVTNLTMALNGGPEGAQVAISGCYAGPIFNFLFGMGLSLAASCWRSYPSSVEIQRNPYLLETVGFLVGGLLWAFVILRRRNMRLDGILGAGLLAIYMISMSLRLIQTAGNPESLSSVSPS
ncbi:hypothetical protein Tsubulata_003539 [Turnera subulata]|uniref:Sodium/calcium exchanger membrane region domain-containing protein n=1 Tax=Turnera subulata TaxID=218843 RepID=A0A9Q0G323_9ROSI|nr:hypothetical protein Tsubulata_003539 [Turnera subulata]